SAISVKTSPPGAPRARRRELSRDGAGRVFPKAAGGLPSCGHRVRCRGTEPLYLRLAASRHEGECCGRPALEGDLLRSGSPGGEAGVVFAGSPGRSLSSNVNRTDPGAVSPVEGCAVGRPAPTRATQGDRIVGPVGARFLGRRPRPLARHL